MSVNSTICSTPYISSRENSRGKQPKPKGTEQNPYPYLSVCKKLQDDEATPEIWRPNPAEAGAWILQASWPPSSPASSCSTMEELEPRARFPLPATAGISVPICDSGRVRVFGRMVSEEDGDARRHATMTAIAR